MVTPYGARLIVFSSQSPDDQAHPSRCLCLCDRRPGVFSPRPARLDESVDCAQRPPPAWLAGGGGGTGDAAEEDDGMGDFMAEILAEEVRRFVNDAIED